MSTRVPGTQPQAARPQAARKRAARRPKAEVRALLAAGRAVASSLAPAEVLERILEAACELLRASAAAVWELTGDGTLQRRAALGLSERYLGAVMTLPPGEGATGLAAREGRIVAITDAAADPRVSVRALWADEGIRAFVSAPLVAEGCLVGVVNVYCRDRRRFVTDELALLAGFADLAAAAIRNARLHEQTLQALSEVSAREALLSTVIGNASDGIIVLDDQYRVVLFNPASERLTGQRAAEVVGRRCFEFLRCRHCGEEPLCHGACPMTPIFTLARDAIPYSELMVDTHEGRERWVGASWAAARDGADGRLLAVMVLRDITAAKEADQMKTAIIGLVSHELRTPLTSIRMLSDLLVEHDFPPAEGRPLLADIASEARRLGRLVEQVLEVARLEGGRVAFEPRPVALAPLAAAAVDLLRNQTERHVFDLDLPADLPAVLGDPDRLRQVLDNLLYNAVKYSPAGGRITVRAIAQATKLQVSVTDEGIGVPSEVLPRLFTPFSRFAGADHAEIEGFGLGLHIVRSLVTLHGGRIWATSTPGCGSTFSFTVRLAALPPTTPTASAASAAPNVASEDGRR